jgi:hypothetical protein
VLGYLGYADLDLGFQLAAQAPGELLAERLQRARDAMPDLGCELRRLGEVERPYALSLRLRRAALPVGLLALVGRGPLLGLRLPGL